MKKLALSALTTFVAAQAMALTPSPDAVAELRAKYDPRVTVAAGESSSDWGCPTRKFTVRGRDPWTGEARDVRVRVYGKLRAGGPAVVLLPPTGGENFIDRSYARALCGRELAAMIVEGWDFDNDITLDFEMHDRSIARALFAVEHAVEFLQGSGVTRIGILGTSVGAMTAGMVLGFDSRLAAGALIVGGTDLPGIVADSTQEILAGLRTRRMASFGLRDQRAYEAAVRAHVRYDTRLFLEDFRPRPVLVVTATADTTVPTRYQELLRARLGAEELRLDGDHTGVIFRTYWSYTDRLADYLQKNL